MIRLGNYSPYKRIIYVALKNLLQYDKNMKIIKVKRGASTFVHFFLQKFFLKLTLKTYVIYTIVVTQSWFRPRTLAHLQSQKILNAQQLLFEPFFNLTLTCIFGVIYCGKWRFLLSPVRARMGYPPRPILLVNF